MIMKNHCGYVALLGRPNVGKSTLLNNILGQKVSITSRKPQTTRHRILGIDTDQNFQRIFVDTPGIQSTYDSAIHRHMNRAAKSTVKEVDVIVFIVDRLNWTDEEEKIVKELFSYSCPVILAINKTDLIEDKNKLLPHIDQLSEVYNWADVVPISAQKKQNLDLLCEAINGYLPEREHDFDADSITDKSVRFISSELIREKIMRQLGDELPHKTAIEIERFEEEPNIVYIDAIIWVEREGQKKILIGTKGERIKSIGIQARHDIEGLVDKKVMLNLWVKIKSSWSDDERMLKNLGFTD